jgi:hypothetical protein
MARMCHGWTDTVANTMCSINENRKWKSGPIRPQAGHHTRLVTRSDEACIFQTRIENDRMMADEGGRPAARERSVAMLTHPSHDHGTIRWLCPPLPCRCELSVGWENVSIQHGTIIKALRLINEHSQWVPWGSDQWWLPRGYRLYVVGYWYDIEILASADREKLGWTIWLVRSVMRCGRNTLPITETFWPLVAAVGSPTLIWSLVVGRDVSVGSSIFVADHITIRKCG